MIGRVCFGIVAALAGGVSADQPPIGHITTQARVPMILNRPGSGYVDLYEFDAWMNEAGASETHVRRVGAPPYWHTTHDGYTPFDVRPGRYAILLHQPEWFLRPAVIPDIVIKAGKNAPRDLAPGLDYACLCGGKLASWERADLPKPWEAATVFHQTFVARGTSITHAHYKLAGAEAKSTRVSIHEVRGQAPERWKQVGPERIDEKIAGLNDNWAGWRSGEVVTKVGKRYALRIEGLNEAGGRTISMLVHRDALGVGYERGTAHADGRKQEYDVYATVSSDSDGNCLPYMRIHDIKPGRLVGSGQWSQTWVAQGKSLAAIDFLVAWGEDQDGVTAEIGIRENDPAGKVIGVPKYARTAWWGPGHGFLGAAWLPGEVTLVPGKTYCATFTPVKPSKYYSASVVNHPKNTYKDGIAYRDGKKRSELDLEMTVVEYKKSTAAKRLPGIYKPKGRNLLANGDFEQDEPNQDSNYDPPGWQRWQTRKTAFWYVRDGRNGSGASRVIGGNINDTAIDGGIVQQVPGLDRKKRYRLSAWVAMSAITDKNYLAAVGYDPTGQTSDPQAKTIVWTAAGRRSFAWEQIVIDDVVPRGSSISVWTRGCNAKVGRLTFHVDFDDVVLEER